MKTAAEAIAMRASPKVKFHEQMIGTRRRSGDITFHRTDTKYDCAPPPLPSYGNHVALSPSILEMAMEHKVLLVLGLLLSDRQAML